MQFLSTVLSLASIAAMASAQMPFPIATKQVPTSVGNKISSDVSVYIASIYTLPAWTSASMALATEEPDLADDPAVNGDPISLAQAFLVATATPAWYTSLGSDVQGYVSSVAAAEASIIAKDSSATPQNQVWVAGAVLAAGAVGMLLL